MIANGFTDLLTLRAFFSCAGNALHTVTLGINALQVHVQCVSGVWVDISAAASAIKSILPPILINLVIFFLGFNY